jgi:hypothetical protein
VPTKIHTQLNAQHGVKVYKFLQPSMIYWRIAILGDKDAITGMHVFEYFSNVLNNDAMPINEREYYLNNLKTVGGFTSVEEFTEEQVSKMLIDSVLSYDVERFSYLYGFFGIKSFNKIQYKSKITGEIYSLSFILEEQRGTINNPFCEIKEIQCV